MITTEGLLRSPNAFGIVTATPAQRAVCRILDGLPLDELRAHPDVVELVGGPDALDALPSERGSMPTESAVLASIRSGKTFIAAAAALRMTQMVDVSRLGPGEIPRVSIVSLKLDLSAVARSILTGTLQKSALLAELVIDDSGDVITLRHPSGRPIQIACVAGAKAGGGLVARWSAGVIFDEAPRMNGADDGVVNLDHARSAVLGRLLPGAQALYIGSAWAPHGPIYDLTQEHWQKPKPHIVVLRGTGPMLNPTWWTPERCAKLQEQDPVAYQTDVLGEFADPESGLLSPIAIRANTREAPLELPYDARAVYCAAVDPAEGAAGGNAWTLIIVEYFPPSERPALPEWVPEWALPRRDWRPACLQPTELAPMKRFRVALAREWRGLRPEKCWQEIAAVCRRYGITHAWADQYAAASNRDLARRFGLTVSTEHTSAVTKMEDFTNLATQLHTDCIELPPDPTLRRDLLSVKRRVTQQGATIVLPRTGDGRHCDFAPALALAIKHAPGSVPQVVRTIRAIGL